MVSCVYGTDAISNFYKFSDFHTRYSNCNYMSVSSALSACACYPQHKTRRWLSPAVGSYVPCNGLSKTTVDFETCARRGSGFSESKPHHFMYLATFRLPHCTQVFHLQRLHLRVDVAREHGALAALVHERRAVYPEPCPVVEALVPIPPVNLNLPLLVQKVRSIDRRVGGSHGDRRRRVRGQLGREGGRRGRPSL